MIEIDAEEFTRNYVRSSLQKLLGPLYQDPYRESVRSVEEAQSKPPELLSVNTVDNQPSRSTKEAQCQLIESRGARTLDEVKFVLQVRHDLRNCPTWKEFDIPNKRASCFNVAMPRSIYEVGFDTHEDKYKPTTFSDIKRYEQDIANGLVNLGNIISAWVNEDYEARQQKTKLQDLSEDRNNLEHLVEWKKTCALITCLIPDLIPEPFEQERVLGRLFKDYKPGKEPLWKIVTTSYAQRVLSHCGINYFSPERIVKLKIEEQAILPSHIVLDTSQEWLARLERERQTWTLPTPEGPWHQTADGRYYRGTVSDGGDSGGSYDPQLQRYRPGGDGGGGFDDLTKRYVDGGDGGGYEEVIPPPWEPHIPNG